MIKTSHFSALLATTCMVFSASAAAQACEGGAYLNPQLFSGESAVQRSRVEQEMRTFMNTTGLPVAAMYSVKQVDEVTSPGRAPYCWIYANQVMGLLSGYKPVVVNTEIGQPAVLVITSAVAGGPRDPGAVPLGTLDAKEQLAVLDQLKRSKCVGTTGGVDTEIVKTEGLCAIVVAVSPQVEVGQQGLIARAAYEWDDHTWAGVVIRSTGLKTGLKGFAGKSDNVHLARLVSVPTKSTSVGFGLYVHASVSDAVVRKSTAAFQNLSAPSPALAVALDLGPKFAFAVPTADQLSKMSDAIGFKK